MARVTQLEPVPLSQSGSLRLVCPVCTTSYPSARCGIRVVSNLLVTVKCPVCGAGFTAHFETTTAPSQTWIDWLLRRPGETLIGVRVLVRAGEEGRDV